MKRNISLVCLLISYLTIFAQRPIVTQFIPVQAKSGDTCIILGSGFNNNPLNNLVYFGTEKARVFNASSNQLEVLIPPGFGKVPVEVVSNGRSFISVSGFTYVNANPLPVNTNLFNAEVKLEDNQPLSSDSRPNSVFRVDLNNDGTNDLLIANDYGYLTAQISKSNYVSSSTHALASTHFPGSGVNAEDIRLSDLDLDGWIDIIHAEVVKGKHTQNCYSNRSKIDSVAFQKEAWTIAGSILTISDFDLDGLKDIISVTAGTYLYYRNISKQGMIQFELADISTSLGDVIAITDLNNDHKPDFITNNSSNFSINVLRNTSNAGFRFSNLSTPLQIISSYTSSSGNYNQINFQDLNGDFLNEIVFATIGTGSKLFICQNSSTQGIVSFQPSFFLTPPAMSAAPLILLTDINGDGKQDINLSYKISSNFGLTVYENVFQVGSLATSSFINRFTYIVSDAYSITHWDKDGTPTLFNMSPSSFDIMGRRYVKNVVNKEIVMDTSWIYRTTPNNSIAVNATLNYIPDSLNVFQVELSDTNGSFINPVTISSISSRSTKLNLAPLIPANLPAGPNYRVRITGSHPYKISNSSKQIIVKTTLPVLDSIAISHPNITSTAMLHGSHFNINGSQVYIGGINAEILSANSNQIEIRLPLGINTDGITLHADGITRELRRSVAISYPGTKNIDSTTFGRLIEATNLNGTTTDISFRLIDINNDNKLDILRSRDVYYNNSQQGVINSSTFKALSYGIYGSNVNSIDYCDVTGSGQKDLVAIMSSSYMAKIGKYYYPLTNTPTRLIMADITGDGKPEMVTLSASSISVYRNTTPAGTDSATFATRMDFTITGTGWNSLHVADMDGDGKVDIIVTNGTNGLISIFKNNSVPNAIILATRFDRPTGYTNSASLIGDLNRDGKPDLIFRRGSSPGLISIFQNNATPGIINTNMFLGSVDYIVTPYEITAFALADFDGDGITDIMAAGGVSSTRLLYFIKNNNTGVFTTSNLILRSMSTEYKTVVGIHAGDINYDGAMDAVLIFNSDPVASILFNKLIPFNTPFKYKHLIVGDSIYVRYLSSSPFSAGNQIQVQLSDTNGSFGSPLVIGSKNTLLANDSVLVIFPPALSGTTRNLRIVASNPSSITNVVTGIKFTSSVQFQFTLSTLSGKAGNQLSITGTDINSILQVKFGSVPSTILSRNASQLICRIPFAANGLPVKIYTTSGLYESKLNFGHTYINRNDATACISCFSFIDIQPETTNKMVLTDFDGDGKQDFVTLNNGVIGVLHNQTQPGNTNTFFHLRSIADVSQLNNPMIHIADLNLDGKDDIIVYESNKIAIVYNRSGGASISTSAVEFINVTNEFKFTGLKVSDINTDGKPDLIFAIRFSSSLYEHKLGFAFFLNQSNSLAENQAADFKLFAHHLLSDYNNYTSALSHAIEFQIKDMNNDGNTEILFSPSHTNRLYFMLLKNRSTLTFDTTSMVVGGDFSTFDMDDIDNNGTPDLILHNSSGMYALINNNLSGAFNKTLITSTLLTSSKAPWGLEPKIIDLDFDGYKDIVYLISDGVYIMKRNKTAAPITASSYQSSITLSSSSYTLSNLFIGDFNLDHKPEIAFLRANYGIKILKNNTNYLQLINLNKPLRNEFVNTIKFTVPANMFSAGNQFTIELSDTNGSFDSPIILGTMLSNTSGEFRFMLPFYIQPSDKYKLRMYGSLPNIASENELQVEVKSCPKTISFEPTRGEPGSEVTIWGNFKKLKKSDVVVYFAECKASITNISDSSLKVIVPDHVREGLIRLTIAETEVTATEHFLPIYTNNGIFDSTCVGVTKRIGLMEPYSYYNSFDQLADLNEDGYLDLKNHTLKYDPLLDTITTLKAFNLNVSSFTKGANKMADISGDGIPDLIGVGQQANCPFPTNPSNFGLSYSIHGNYSGYYTPNGGQNYTFQNITNCYANGINFTVGDFNNDGNNDMLVEKVNGTQYVLLKRIEYPTTFWIQYNHTNISASSNTNRSYEDIELISEDINGDNSADLISKTEIKSINYNFASNAVTLGQTYYLPESNNGTCPILLCDFNQDGKKDILRFETQYQLSFLPYIRINRNRSTTTNYEFASATSILRLGIKKVLSADYNGDGLPDLIVLWSDSNAYQYIDILKNISTINNIAFDTNQIRIKVPYTARITGVFDITNDKKPDLLLTNFDTLLLIKNTTPVLRGELIQSTICANDSLRLNLNASDISFGSGNQFTVELSDTSGSFHATTILGIVNKASGGQISLPLPSSIIPSNLYKVRVSASQPAMQVVFNTNQLTVKKIPVLSHTWPTANQLCDGDSMTLTVTAPNPSYTYYWKRNGTQLPDSNLFSKVIKQSGNYALLAQEGGCETPSSTYLITFQPKPNVNIQLQPSNIVCGNDSITLYTVSVPRYVYRWFKNGISQVNDTLFSIRTNQAGTYSLQVTDSNNCSSQSTNTSVYQRNKPVASISSNKILSLCQGDSVTISAPPFVKMKYNWLFNNSGFAGDSLRIIRMKNQGILSLILTDSLGCKSQRLDTLINVFQLPTASIIASKTQFCSGDSILLNSAINSNYKQYIWIKNNTILAGDTLPHLKVTLGGSYRLLLVDSNNCSNSSRDTVITENALPVNTLTLSSNTICEGDTATLSAINGPNYHYQWFKNAVVLPTDTFRNLKVTQTGNYHFLIVDNKSCINISKDTLVKVNPLPISRISVVPVQKLCEGDSIQLYTTYFSNFQYRWFKNSTYTSTNTPTLVVKNSGTYRLEITDSNGCIKQSQDTFLFFHSNPTASITISGSADQCVGDSLMLQTPFSNGLSYQWVQNAQNIPNDTLFYFTSKYSGSYKVKVSNTSTGCFSISGDTTITFHAPPAVGLTVQGPVDRCEGDSIMLSANMNPFYHYKWYRNNTLLPIDTLNLINVKSSGNYSVIVGNQFGCESLPATDTTLTFHAHPNINISVQGSVNRCAGDSIILSTSMDPFYNYKWYKDSISLTNDTLNFLKVKSSGSYSVIVSDQYGCESLPSDTFLRFYSIPTRPFITRTGNSLQSSSTSENQWYLNGLELPGEVNQTITLTSYGVYQVAVITSPANCASDTSLPYLHSNLGTVEFKKKNAFLIFPNPSNDNVNVHTESIVKEFVLIDAVGRIFTLAWQKENNGYTIDLRSFLDGTYILRITESDKTISYWPITIIKK